MITLIKAFRADENTVYVMYAHTERGQRFVVEWSNIHPETGEISDYDLQLDCLSNSEALNIEVTEAVSDGDSELYSLLSETFDRLDCEGL